MLGMCAVSNLYEPQHLEEVVLLIHQTDFFNVLLLIHLQSHKSNNKKHTTIYLFGQKGTLSFRLNDSRV